MVWLHIMAVANEEIVILCRRTIHIQTIKKQKKYLFLLRRIDNNLNI